MFDPCHDDGLGLLSGAVVDPHWHSKGREADLFSVLAEHPELQGLAIDDGTTVIIRGHEATVLGDGEVGWYVDADTMHTYAAGETSCYADAHESHGERTVPAVTASAPAAPDANR